MEKIWVVIAAYYENESIQSVVEELIHEGYENVVVVNDGSDEATSKEARAGGAIVLEHLVNRGQGAALRTGMEYAIEHGADIIIHLDADGQHKVEDIPRMIQPLNEEGYDITLGSRFLKEQDVPFAKKIVLKLGILFQAVTTGLWLSDTHNGFRAMKAEAAEKLKIKQDRMGHATEIIDLIRRHNLKYKEVPVTIEYNEYAVSKGQSVFNAVNIAFKNLYHKFLK